MRKLKTSINHAKKRATSGNRSSNARKLAYNPASGYCIHNYACKAALTITFACRQGTPKAMTDPRIAPLALYQHVAERLRQQIFAHELAPGEWIDEQALAQTFGISRTPLREALKVLATEGLVTLKPRRGCYVTEISPQDLDEVFDVLALLESECARRVAQRLDDDTLARLDGLHADLENAFAADDLEAFFGANQVFHDALHEMADNRWLRQTIVDLRRVIMLSRHHSLYSEERRTQSLAEHRALLAAFHARDAELAARLMHEHIAHARDSLLRQPTPAPATS